MNKISVDRKWVIWKGRTEEEKECLMKCKNIISYEWKEKKLNDDFDPSVVYWCSDWDKPKKQNKKPLSIKPGDTLRLPAYNGGFRVWGVIGCHYGAVSQESVIQLKVLDRTDQVEGNGIFVPIEILDAANVEKV